MSVNALAVATAFLVSMSVLAGMIISWRFHNRFPQTLKKRLLSVNEHEFLKCLERALGDEYYVFAKIRLDDIVDFDKSSTLIGRYAVNKQLNNVCADYVLCKKKDMTMLGVIELEKFDKSLLPQQKKRREELLSSVCRAVDIKLFYFDSRQDYSGMDLRRLITGRTELRQPQNRVSISAEASMMSVEEHSQMEVGVVDKIRSCPKCYSDVVVKIAVKGENIGNKFLMCRKFPYCDYQLALNSSKVRKIQQNEDVRRSKAGYRNW